MTGDPKLSRAARAAIVAGENRLFISSVTAFEFVDLNRRGRFTADLPFEQVLDRLEATVLGVPSSMWIVAKTLPAIHFDPVDRMLVAHAIHADLTIVTADSKIPQYPVRTIW